MKKCLLLTVLSLISLTCNADYNDGLEAYQQGDYQRALKQWKAVAEQKTTLSHDLEWKLGRTQDTTEAQYGLALLYWQGKGVIQNYHEAQKWLALAADSGHSEAQLKLAYIYLSGLSGAKTNIPEAIKWFEKSAKQGNADAQYNLGLLYKDGRAVKQDIPAAKKWLTLAARQGDAGSKALLAEMGVAPVAEESSVVAQQTPNKSAEPQLIVGPYPDAPATQAVENPEVVAPTPAQPTLSKVAKPALITSIATPAQAVKKEPQLIVAPYPIDLPATQAVENPEVVAPTPAQPILSKAAKPALITSIAASAQGVEKTNVITPSSAPKTDDPVLLTNSITQAVAKPVAVIPTPAISQSTPVQNTPASPNDEHYAVQLLSSPKQNDTLAFVEHWRASLSPLVATDKLKKSERIFIVVYGHYASPSEAKQAIASLPDELKKNRPWVIKMRGNTFVP